MTMEVAPTERPSGAADLSVEQIRALSYRASAPDASLRQVARVAGVSDSTLRRWISSSEFAHLWRNKQEAADAIVRAQRGRLESISLATLIRVQEDDAVAASVQVDAASKGLTYIQRAAEHETPSADSQLAAMMLGWASEGRAERERLEREAEDGEWREVGGE